MRIESSTIQMASTRNYAAEANETITSVNRFYGTNGEVQKTVSGMSQVKLSQYEVSGGTSVSIPPKTVLFVQTKIRLSIPMRNPNPWKIKTKAEDRLFHSPASRRIIGSADLPATRIRR